MTWCWLARCDGRPADAFAAAPLVEVGEGPAGTLAAWERAARPPVDGAVKVDARAIDPDGTDATACLVLASAGTWLPFDDPAVSGALRTALGMPAADVLSILLVGDDRFVGALTASHRQPARVLDFDPFERLFPCRRLHVGAGLLGSMPAPVGPGIQRYGATNPWPFDRFES